MKKHLRRIFLPIIAVIASWSIAATPAFAYDESMHTNDGDPGGVVYWTAYGDKFEVCDIEADGWAVVGSIDTSKYYDGPYDGGYSLTVGGNGKCVYRDAGDGGAYDLPENTYVRVYVCLYKDGGYGEYCDLSVWLNN
ncbi:hypothetical protein [Streptomyces sp. Ru62]|uniref:hypothetical protein n=1 Tax=Streptomyces sp. Ru62 TaxID=2080745 RepID=UPI0011B0BC55|nr:hypothetical protein [Streptomyces sp. Ru62]